MDWFSIRRRPRGRVNAALRMSICFLDFAAAATPHRLQTALRPVLSSPLLELQRPDDRERFKQSSQIKRIGIIA